MNSRLRHLFEPTAAAASLALLMLVTWLCYQPGLGGPFLLDDPVNIPQTELPRLTLAAVEDKIFTDPNVSPFFRTIGRLSFALTIHFHGLDAFSFKYQNLMLHLINGLLMFWLVWLLAARLGPEGASARHLWFAFAVAAIWLLHPLQVSTVLYAVQRLMLLATMFVLLALISYVKGRVLAQTRPAAGTALALAGTLAFGTLGVMSKETAALLPLFVVAIEFFVFRFAFDDEARRRRLGVLLGAVAVVPTLAAVLYGVTRIPDFALSYAGRDFDLPERLMTQAHVLLMYLRLFFVPVPGEMSLFHDNFPVTRALDAGTVALTLLYAALLATAVWLRRRLPLTALGIAWFFAAHLLESTILPLELAFEHRNYLALLGPALVLVDALRQLSGSRLLRRALPAALAGLLLILGLNTAARASVWGDLRVMLATEYERRPDSSRVVGYLAEMNMLEGNTRLAKRFVDELLAIGRADAGAELMNILVRCGEDEIRAPVFERARDKLATGTVSVFSFESLNRLTRDYVQGNCPALSFGQADALLRAAAPNPRSTGGLPCLIAHIRSKLLISQGKWASTPEALSLAVDRCQATSDSLFRFIMADWVRFALDVGGPDRVLKAMNALPREQAMKIAHNLDPSSFPLPSAPE
jgi:hypothetical protein